MTAVSPTPIPIGGMTPLTGPSAADGAEFRNGIILAAEEINARGGLLGRPIRPIFADTGRQSAVPACGLQPMHPWTHGQVERMNRTIKEATVKRFHYDSNDQLTSHLADFIAAYNFGRRLKTLKGLTPYEAICKPGQKSRKDSLSIQSIKCRTNHLGRMPDKAVFRII